MKNSFAKRERAISLRSVIARLIQEKLVMIGAVARAGSSLLAGKPIEKVGSEVLKVVSSYNVSSTYHKFVLIPIKNVA